MNIFKRFWRDYHLESVVVVASLLLTTGTYSFLIKGVIAKEFIPIASAGFLFVVAQMYGRLKDRRDAKRKRAQDLFLEWHSKEIRESRIYLSRWRLNMETSGQLPSLGEIESAAADEYRIRYRSPDIASGARKADLHELDNPELREFHAFKLYQFFERWALLVKNNDIDYRSANEYMHSYKDWWLDSFIVPWMNNESDEYLRSSLSEVIRYVRPNKISDRLWLRKKKVGTQSEEIVEKASTPQR